MLERASKKQKLSQGGILQCCICSVEDGTYHASKTKTDISHVTTLTENWRVMAITVGNEFLLNKLAFGDVAANDMFYHSKCLKKLGNVYKQVMESKYVDNNAYECWIRAVAFDKVISFVFDTEGKNPGTIFHEDMYI